MKFLFFLLVVVVVVLNVSQLAMAGPVADPEPFFYGGLFNIFRYGFKGSWKYLKLII